MFGIFDPSSPLCPHFTQPISPVRPQNEPLLQASLPPQCGRHKWMAPKWNSFDDTPDSYCGALSRNLPGTIFLPYFVIVLIYYYCFATFQTKRRYESTWWAGRERPRSVPTCQRTSACTTSASLVQTPPSSRSTSSRSGGSRKPLFVGTPIL